MSGRPARLRVSGMATTAKITMAPHLRRRRCARRALRATGRTGGGNWSWSSYDAGMELLMDEREFDALLPLRPYASGDFAQAEARSRRSTALGMTLWGRTAADLERQLLAPHPEIPSGFDLADFYDLLHYTQLIVKALNDPGRKSLFPFADWEARCEIVRRAIDYLERR